MRYTNGMIPSTIRAVRAIGAEFVRRTMRPLMVAGIATAILLVAIAGWLTTVNVWWWILEALILLVTLVGVAVAIAIRIAIQTVDPPQDSVQRQAVRSYVDKLQRVAENLQTPQYVILYRVIRDTVRPKDDGFIGTVSRDSKTLGPEFAALLKHFK